MCYTLQLRSGFMPRQSLRSNVKRATQSLAKVADTDLSGRLANLETAVTIIAISMAVIAAAALGMVVCVARS